MLHGLTDGILSRFLWVSDSCRRMIRSWSWFDDPTESLADGLRKSVESTVSGMFDLVFCWLIVYGTYIHRPRGLLTAIPSTRFDLGFYADDCVGDHFLVGFIQNWHLLFSSIHVVYLCECRISRIQWLHLGDVEVKFSTGSLGLFQPNNTCWVILRRLFTMFFTTNEITGRSPSAEPQWS